MTTNGTDTTPIEEKISIAAIDQTLNTKNKMTLQHIYCQTDANGVEDNKHYQEGFETTGNRSISKATGHGAGCQ